MHGARPRRPALGVRGDAEARTAQAARLGKGRARAQRRVDDVLRRHTLPSASPTPSRRARGPLWASALRKRRNARAPRARHLRRIRGPDEGAAMKEAKRPNSRRNLDIAIDRLCASTGDEPGRVKRLLATAIVGQMLPDGAAKGGNALKIPLRKRRHALLARPRHCQGVLSGRLHRAVGRHARHRMVRIHGDRRSKRPPPRKAFRPRTSCARSRSRSLTTASRG